MREILFRGKRVDNGEWVEGSLIHQTKFYGDPVDCYHILYDGEFHADYYGSAEVIPETVGQFTGLLDKNGKKIFEGDIMRNAGNVVEFCSDGFCINGDSPLAFWTKTEIIGNIHDNPEVLEVKK